MIQVILVVVEGMGFLERRLRKFSEVPEMFYTSTVS
jgi:hypothetical protein